MQNLAVAAAVIVALVLVDLFGHLPLPLGVLGHEGSTVVVGLNGLRLLSGRAWRHSAPATDATPHRSSHPWRTDCSSRGMGSAMNRSRQPRPQKT